MATKVYIDGQFIEVDFLPQALSPTSSPTFESLNLTSTLTIKPSGSGTWADPATPLYADSTGLFSVADKMTFDPGSVESGGLGSLIITGKVYGAIQNFDIVQLDKGKRNLTFGSLSSNVVTLTTAVNHGFLEGDTVLLEDIGTGAFVPLSGGAFRVQSVPTPTTFTVNYTAADIASVAIATGTAKVRELTLGLHPQMTSPDGGIISPAGIGIRLDENNYWFLNNKFKVGSTTRFLTWDGSALTLTGTVNATAGNFSGNVTVGTHISDRITLAATGTANSTAIYSGTTTYGAGSGFWMDASGRFSLGGNLTWNGTTLSVTGAVTATSGTFTGTVNANAGNFSNTVTVGQHTNKISLTGTAFDTTTKVHSGVGTYADANTGFYLDASGRFSLGDRLTWNGTNTLSLSGSVNATGGNFSNTVTVGQDTNKISLTGTALDTTTKIHSGAGNYNNTDTGFYLDASGRMSLKQSLLWDGSALTVAGTVNASAGNFTGYVTAGTMRFGANVSTTLDGLWIDANNYWYDTGAFSIGGVNGLSYTGSGQINIGTGVTVSGPISGSTIDIGGADATSFHVDINGNVWAGAATFNTGTNPFSVTSAGALTARSGEIGGFTIGTSSLIAGTGSTRIGLQASGTEALYAGGNTPSTAPFSIRADGSIKFNGSGSRDLTINPGDATYGAGLQFSGAESYINNYWVGGGGALGDISIQAYGRVMLISEVKDAVVTGVDGASISHAGTGRGLWAGSANTQIRRSGGTTSMIWASDDGVGIGNGVTRANYVFNVEGAVTGEAATSRIYRPRAAGADVIFDCWSDNTATRSQFRVMGNGDAQNRGNSYGAWSDGRLKDNIETARSYLPDLLKLRPVKYSWKEDEEKTRYLGLIAQEVQEVMPGLVTEDEEGILSVKYSILVPMLLTAIQELSAKINELSK